MSSVIDDHVNAQLTPHKFTINWQVVFGGVGILGTIVAFLYNILIVSENNQVQIETFHQNMTQLQGQVTSEFADIQKHLDTMEHSIGRIEGRLDGTESPRGISHY